MKLEGKNILLISPQKWGKMHVSKHHYAIELSKRGNKVFYLAPPSSKNKTQFLKEYPNLSIIEHKLFFPGIIRFHLRPIFNFLMQIHVKRLLKKLPDIDIVWCFESNLYSNLNWFGAKTKIYHPVDPVNKKQADIGNSADIIFSVSEKILESFEHINKPKHFINHALAPHFEKTAQTALKKFKDYRPGKPVKIGYVGNLTRPIIDREAFLSFVKAPLNTEFHIWGPYEQKNNNLEGDDGKEVTDFINELKERPNVKLLGSRLPAVLATEIQEPDLFFLTYKSVEGLSDLSNAHKIIEYLSTGKVIVANHLSTYEGYKDLIVMPDKGEEKNRLELFEKTVKEIRFYNSEKLFEERIQLALDNSIRNQLNRISELLPKSN